MSFYAFMSFSLISRVFLELIDELQIAKNTAECIILNMISIKILSRNRMLWLANPTMQYECICCSLR